jgi:hypothetical protein
LETKVTGSGPTESNHKRGQGSSWTVASVEKLLSFSLRALLNKRINDLHIKRDGTWRTLIKIKTMYIDNCKNQIRKGKLPPKRVFFTLMLIR